MSEEQENKLEVKRHGLTRALETLNNQLKQNEFICGDSITLVDILFFCDLSTVIKVCGH